MSELLAAWMREAGIKRRRLDGRGAHALRRTCATTLLEHGSTLVDVAAVLGHSQLSSTQRYLALPDAKRLLAVIETGPMAAWVRPRVTAVPVVMA
jgi:integrase